MKLYDIVAADGEFVESLTQREIMNKFGLTKCRFRTFLNNSYLIDGKYWIDDSAEDMQVTRNGCRKMLKQFDALTEDIRRLSDGKVKNQAEKENIHSVYESAGSYICAVYPELPERVKRDGAESL